MVETGTAVHRQGGFQERHGSRRQFLEVRAFELVLRSVGLNCQVKVKGQHFR